MDSYKIEFKSNAWKDLKAIQKPFVKKISNKIYQLSVNPFPHGFKKLKSSETIYRIMVGEYRVIYSINQSLRLITVYYIRHRKDIYKN